MTITEEALKSVKGLGEVKVNELVEQFGSPESVAQASIDELMAIKGISENIAHRVKDLNGTGNGKRKSRGIKGKKLSAQGEASARVQGEASRGTVESYVATDIALDGTESLRLMTVDGVIEVELSRPSLVVDLYRQTRDSARQYVNDLRESLDL